MEDASPAGSGPGRRGLGTPHRPTGSFSNSDPPHYLAKFPPGCPAPRVFLRGALLPPVFWGPPWLGLLCDRRHAPRAWSTALPQSRKVPSPPSGVVDMHWMSLSRPWLPFPHSQSKNKFQTAIPRQNNRQQQHTLFRQHPSTSTDRNGKQQDPWGGWTKQQITRKTPPLIAPEPARTRR